MTFQYDISNTTTDIPIDHRLSVREAVLHCFLAVCQNYTFPYARHVLVQSDLFSACRAESFSAAESNLSAAVHSITRELERPLPSFGYLTLHVLSADGLMLPSSSKPPRSPYVTLDYNAKPPRLDAGGRGVLWADGIARKYNSIHV